MANSRTAARFLGDDYQAYYFWLYAFKMLLENSKIATVAYEDGAALPFDDVTVYYAEQRKNEYTNTCYDRDYYQCKFKVSGEKSLKWTDLIDPAYYGNKESLLQRAYKLYFQEANKNFRLVLCTPICFDNGDDFYKYSKCAEHGLDVDSMFVATDKKTRNMLSSIQVHLGNPSNDNLKEFISLFRFHMGKSIHDLKIDLQEKCGMSNVKYDLSLDGELWTSLIKKLNLQKRTRFDKQSIQTICFNENLFGANRKEIGVIGIAQNDDRTVKLRCLGENCLDLSKHFIDRKIRSTTSWEYVINEAKAFVNEKIIHGECFNVSLSAIYSVAFLLGKLIGFKKGDVALRNRNGLWIKNLALNCPVTSTNEISYCNDTYITSDEVAICISVAPKSIVNDVVEYMKDESVPYQLLSIHRAMDDITNNAVWDFASSCHDTVLCFLKRKQAKNVRFFYRGPTDIVFILGQYANEWGKCQIYDFSFGADAVCDKKYFKGIKL